MEEEQERRGQLALELDRDAYHVKGASFAPDSGGEGGLFSCSIGPITDETAAALEQAAHAHSLVNLVFSDHPVLLDLVMLERKEPKSVLIVGHVVKPTTKQTA